MNKVADAEVTAEHAAEVVSGLCSMGAADADAVSCFSDGSDDFARVQPVARTRCGSKRERR